MKLKQLTEARLAGQEKRIIGYVVIVREENLERIESTYGPFNSEQDALSFVDVAYGQIGVNWEDESHMDVSRVEVLPVKDPNAI